MKLKPTLALTAAVALAGLSAGCASTTATPAASDVAVYAGTLQAMNTAVTGAATTGKVKLVVRACCRFVRRRAGGHFFARQGVASAM